VLRKEAGMEKVLRELFSFQKFEKNESLGAIVNEVDEKYDTIVSLSDLDLSFAVGGQSDEATERAVRELIEKKLSEK